MTRMDEAVERVLATGELPDLPFEPGVPVPVAFWRQGETSIVFLIVCRKDGSFHYLAVSGEYGDLAGGPLGDELPERTGLDLYAEVGFGGTSAVLGFAPDGAETVRFEKAGSEAAVNPRNGAFVVGVVEVEPPYADQLVAAPVGTRVAVEFEEHEMPDLEPGFSIEDKVWRPDDG